MIFSFAKKPKQDNKLKQYKRAIKRSSKLAVAVYFVLRTLVLACMVRELWLGNLMGALLCLVSLVLFTLPQTLERILKIEIPGGLEICVYCFIFAAEILGEIENFYQNIEMWDVALHTINGFLAASVGFSLVFIMNERSKMVQLSPVFVSLVAFCFSMTIAVLWEFSEYALDGVMKFNMQKDTFVSAVYSDKFDKERGVEVKAVQGIEKTLMLDASGEVVMELNGGYLDIGLNDTMKDMFVNLIGAVVFDVLGYYYIIGRDKWGITNWFKIKLRQEENEATE